MKKENLDFKNTRYKTCLVKNVKSYSKINVNSARFFARFDTNLLRF